MSPSTLSTQSILQTIADQELGFKFGEPDRPSDKSLSCILPILRKTSQERQYVTFPETEQVVVSDSGSIYKLNFKNTSKQNVFLRSGTIFEGKGTQSRALTRSTVIYPGTEVGLDVRCVHQSHGIRSDAKFGYGGITPYSVESANYTSGFRPRDQQSMWDSVRDYSYTVSRSVTGSAQSGGGLRGRISKRSASMRSVKPIRASGMQLRSTGLRSLDTDPSSNVTTTTSNGGGVNWNTGGTVGDPGSVYLTDSVPESFIPASDNLKQSFDEFAKNFDAILSKARLHDDQVGLALITDTGVKTVEVFDLPTSWEAIHTDSVRKMGTELLRGPDDTNVFKYIPENAINSVRKVLGLQFKTNRLYLHEPSNGEPKLEIFGLTAGKYVGEVVELDNRVIHLVIIETQQA